MLLLCAHTKFFYLFISKYKQVNKGVIRTTQNQHTRELTRTRKMSHKHINKDPSLFNKLSGRGVGGGG